MLERDRSENITDSVRSLARRVVRESTKILHIDFNAVDKVLLPALKEYQESGDSKNYFGDSDLGLADEAGLNLFMDVVNFCYQNPNTRVSYSYTDKEGKKVPRALGFKAAMKYSGIKWGDIKEVAAITPSAWSDMIQLGQNPDFYLGAERGKRITGFAKNLLERGFSSVEDYFSALNFNAESVLSDLNDSGYFTDEFQKRSQLAVNAVSGVYERRTGKGFSGVEKLTVMADYRLPQYMYNLGAIVLSDPLKEALTLEKIIKTGSPEEMALRAATIVVGERVSKYMGITEGQADSLLWALSVKLGLSGKMTIPHMLVPTDKY